MQAGLALGEPGAGKLAAGWGDEGVGDLVGVVQACGCRDANVSELCSVEQIVQATSQTLRGTTYVTSGITCNRTSLIECHLPGSVCCNSTHMHTVHTCHCIMLIAGDCSVLSKSISACSP